MKATIISIGNELLNGKTVNSNASYIGGKLYEIGITPRQIFTVGDDAAAIQDSLRQALNGSGSIIVTGGLGPTHDDITKKAAADFFASPLVLDEALLQKIEERYRQRELPIPESNRSLAMMPAKARRIDNPVGTAAGIHFEEPDPLRSGFVQHVFILPGVPREMQAMMDEYIIPFLREINTESPLKVGLYRTTGIAESKLYEKVRHLLEAHPDYEVAFLPKTTGADMRIVLKQQAPGEAERFADFEESLYRLAGEYIYTTANEELEEVLGRLLRERRMSLAAAESCTGGLVQDKISNIPGSSDYFMGGIVAYSNESKMKHLKVRRESLERHGAVSEAVAKEMAEGVRRAFGTGLGISTTGIAGPGGASAEKPVGLIYLGLATAERVIIRKLILGGNRVMIKERGAQAALELLRRELLGIPFIS